MRAGARRIRAGHARRFAEQHVEGEIDGAVFEMRIFEDELFFLGGFADNGEGAALAFAESREGGEELGGHGHHVTFL